MQRRVVHVVRSCMICCMCTWKRACLRSCAIKVSLFFTHHAGPLPQRRERQTRRAEKALDSYGRAWRPFPCASERYRRWRPVASFKLSPRSTLNGVEPPHPCGLLWNRNRWLVAKTSVQQAGNMQLSTLCVSAGTIRTSVSWSCERFLLPGA